MRDARRGRASLSFFSIRARRLGLTAGLLAGLSLGIATRVDAQLPRPWLDWRTVETEHFVLHYTEPYREWSLALAARIEGVRTQVQAIVGYVPPRRVHIVIDDPSNAANGTAFTPLDAPTMILWPTPPSPRDEIGNFHVWSEFLATHEFAHNAHMARPARNRLRGLLWSLSPVPLGPIATRAPRWAIEGYATYVEGRVTGTGRPNHAWRAAVLRQFALEGQLPAYETLNNTGGFKTGSFAYLAGSAFIEWLAQREGDSSVTAIWRRMTAKADRSFDAAFAGVYGGPPSQLYGRFKAELTANALALERALPTDVRVPSTLVQRLTRNTGDPAVSPDGRFVALAVRRTDAPSELVVWRTVEEPDPAASRRRAAVARRDSADVPDRQFYPLPKQPVISLVAVDGASYESPRWMPDNKHLLLSRLLPAADGTVRPDLFRWSAEFGTLERLTRGAALRHPDPSADGSWAAAVRCDRGWCDLVRYDLGTGAIRVIRAGSPSRNYYRPRVSWTTGEIAVSEQLGDRWRIALVAAETGALRYADPDDGAVRYDAAFAVDGRTLIATSEATGVPNLERLHPAMATAAPLTAVTGAAVAADVAPDGSVWFLALRSGGYDLHRLAMDSASVARTRHAAPQARLALIDSGSPVLPPRNARLAMDTSRRPTVARVGDERAYGAGPSRFRYVPSLTAGYGGSSALLALVRSDPVGRLGISALAAVGTGALPAGIAAIITSRHTRTVFSAYGWTSHEAPAYLLADTANRGLDKRRTGAALQVARRRASDGGDIEANLALLAERQVPSFAAIADRRASIATATLTRRQRDESTRFVEVVHGLAEFGRTHGGNYFRQRASLLFGTARGTAPLTTLQVGFGKIGGGDGSLRERYILGGFASPLLDPIFDARRVEAPAYPMGSARSASFSTWRVGLPLAPVELFYSGASPDLFQTAFRSYGAELRQKVAAIHALGTPDVDIVTGLARAVDAPVKGEWRYYLTFALRP